MDKALDDITVIDLGQVIAMPFCTMLLADMGAKVIKVESRGQSIAIRPGQVCLWFD